MLPKSKHLYRRFKVRGNVVEVVTVTGLAEIVGKSRCTILRYENSGVFPQALLVVDGNRYYPLTLAHRLKPLVEKIPLRRPPSAELVCEINKVFKEEREKLCQKH